jgi:ankyrin repeat protein
MADADPASALKVMQDLVAAGVPVDSADAEGVTPFMLAVRNGSIQAVRVLLAAGAAVSARLISGFTALHVASMPTNGRMLPRPHLHNSELVLLLIEAGVPASVADFKRDQQEGRLSPLDVAAATGCTAFVEELCRHLSANGAVAEFEMQESWCQHCTWLLAVMSSHKAIQESQRCCLRLGQIPWG